MLMIDGDNRRRIAQDFGVNMVVEAGAGTGKTTLLVERAFRAMVEQGLHPSQLVLVTFMERAAEEIRERLRLKLEDEQEIGADDRRARIRFVLRRLDRAIITTIHGLGQRILSEFPVQARVPIGFAVLDGYERDRLWAECWHTWLRRAHPEKTAKVLDDLLAVGETQTSLKAMATEIESWPTIPQQQAPPFKAWAFFVDWRARLRRWYEESEGVALGGEEDPGRAQMRHLVEYLDWVCACDERTQSRMLMAWSYPLSGKGNQKTWSPEYMLKHQKALIKEFKVDLEAAQSHYAEDLLSRWLTALSQDLFPFWQEYRFQQGRLGFDDLLRQARDLLNRDPAIRTRLHERWRIILVDEFQDTDPVQSEILVRLAGDPLASDWKSAPIPPGRLFVVGDAKQSIYRFRGADVETFQSMREHVLQGGGAVLKVRQNFRSDQEILDWVNEIFALQRWGAYVGSYDPLVATLRQGGRARVRINAQRDLSRADERRRAEAEATAQLILQAMEEKWTVRDRRTGEPRAVRFGDMAVLMPNRTGLDWYRDIFQAEGIPLASVGGVGFFRQDEVRGFSALLSFLADPDDEVAWLAFLLSPWVGASHRQLEAYCRARGGFKGSALLENEGIVPSPEEAQLSDWHHLLREWLRAYDDRLPVDVFDSLAEASGLIPLLQDRGDQQALANLGKLREMARIHGRAWGFGAFEEWLRERIGLAPNESEGVVEELGEAVQLSTVHQAKGLEWPLCIVTNWHQEPHPMPRILLDRMSNTAAWYKTPAYERLKAAEREREEAEHVRMLYVALTRARDYLLMVERLGERQTPAFPLGDGKSLSSPSRADGVLTGAGSAMADKRNDRVD